MVGEAPKNGALRQGRYYMASYQRITVLMAHEESETSFPSGMILLVFPALEDVG